MSDGSFLVLVLDDDASAEDIGAVVARVREGQPGAAVVSGDGWKALAVGEAGRPGTEGLGSLSAVARTVDVTAPYRLASREVFDADVAVDVPVGDTGVTIRFGGGAPLILSARSRWAMGGETRLELIAPLLKEAGCRLIHLGALRPAAGPASGFSAEVLRTARDIAHEHGLAVSIEVASAAEIEEASALADLLVVGSPSMQDFALLRELGRSDRPVLLRRGAGSTVEEFLLAAEYVLAHGNGRVILCESGIRTFDALRKPRFEINAVPLLRASTHLPVIADPSSCAPRAEAVPALARAAAAAGADGIVIEVGTEAVHDPEGAAVDIATLRKLVADLRRVARAVGRSLANGGAAYGPAPRDADEVLRRIDRTLGQVIESIIGVPPDLDVFSQWRIPAAAVSRLAPDLSGDGDVLARATGYRMGRDRLSRNLAFVDLGRIDPTLGALLETGQLNLGQLFVDPGIAKIGFEFGTDRDAGEIDEILRERFADDGADLHPYVWRRYRAAIRGVVSFVVVETLPLATWNRLVDDGSVPALQTGSAR